jgi:hypothetical protein
MDGYKNSTRTHYMKGGSCEGYAKGGKVKGAAKIAKVMGEFKSGKLHSGSKEGPEVTNPKQAVAIALSEARKAGAKVPVKRAGGTPMGKGPEGVSTRPTDAKGRRMTMAELEQSNRDLGSMSKSTVEAAGRAVARGNRMAVEEGNESRLVGRKTTPKSREVSVKDMRSYSRAEPAEPETTLSRRLGRPVPASEMEMARRGPAGAGFSVTPLVNKVRGALGLKNGGLATMPRGKKC